jgi:hypothetical protein
VKLIGKQAALALACLAVLCSCTPSEKPPTTRPPISESERLRRDSIRRARLWGEPPLPIEVADLGSNPPGPDAFQPRQEIACEFRLTGSKGRTPKFHCVLPDGKEIKVKYGRDNSEVFAEAAASRLLAALGFGTDRIDVVAKVRCSGCPPFPYPRLPWLDALLQAEGRVREFDWAIVERPLEGRPIEGEDGEGWEWPELDGIDPAAGGASRAEVEAFRLLAVFLNHWDAKATNHGLACVAEDASGQGQDCVEVVAYIRDAGKTFGPRAVDLERWRRSPIWTDAATCQIGMRELPYQGASFGDARISEGGRLFLAERLRKLSEAQVRELFAGARFADYTGGRAIDRSIEGWVQAFLERVRQIADRPPCRG